MCAGQNISSSRVRNLKPFGRDLNTRLLICKNIYSLNSCNYRITWIKVFNSTVLPIWIIDDLRVPWLATTVKLPPLKSEISFSFWICVATIDLRAMILPLASTCLLHSRIEENPCTNSMHHFIESRAKIFHVVTSKWIVWAHRSKTSWSDDPGGEKCVDNYNDSKDTQDEIAEHFLLIFSRCHFKSSEMRQ